MNRTDLIELIRDDENSGVEFKRDDISPEKLANEMAGLLNLEGGRILLGVENDQTVSGLTRDRRQVEEWVMQVARDRLQPAVIPYWEAIDGGEGRLVGVITLPADAPDKPYKAKRGSVWVTKVRVGTTTRDATREEEQRLYQQSGGLRYGLKPVPGATVDTLDSRRLEDYFGRVMEAEESFPQDPDERARLLVNLEFATVTAGRAVPTVDGTLLFGRNPKRALPQSGIRALCYPGEEPDYATRADEDLRGPLVPLRNEDGQVVEPGLVDQAWDFVRRNTTPSAYLEGTRRVDRWEYPESVIREAVGNALVHRDYSITGTDVTLVIYSNRLEVVSPGRLPNTVTTEGMKLGMRFARNQNLVNIMRDYGYVEWRGMGVRNKIIPGMRTHNGTEPELVEEEHRFTVRLWKTGDTGSLECDYTGGSRAGAMDGSLKWEGERHYKDLVETVKRKISGNAAVTFGNIEPLPENPYARHGFVLSTEATERDVGVEYYPHGDSSTPRLADQPFLIISEWNSGAFFVEISSGHPRRYWNTDVAVTGYVDFRGEERLFQVDDEAERHRRLSNDEMAERLLQTLLGPSAT